ncbi:MAG: RraA family protein [Candidatus Obscuribacterales bacterium]|nr:RraA family protein [Candidatus Obscuribacterales bacterium]
MSTLIHTGSNVSTAQIADACMRLKVPFRIAPAGIKPVIATTTMICGPVIPVRHYGSVDVFLEALERGPQNGIMVIDNGGRTDEACIGDLVVLEVKNAGLKAMLVWGLHRDTNDLIEIAFPVFSYGSFPSGPSRLEAREPEAFKSARFGDFITNAEDTVFADLDGAIFVETIHAEKILELAATIRESEKKQAIDTANGISLRQQFQFSEFLMRRDSSADYTFRKHLSSIAKAIEE